MDPVRLYVSVPVASFRAAGAREYWDTYPCPPPSTVYGMLLSLVGESDRLAHEGAELALALVGAEPELSTVLRLLWRVRFATTPLGIGANKRPDYQELLTGLRFRVDLRAGGEPADRPPLAERVRGAFARPAEVTRFGGLSLGESSHLVDEVRPWRATDGPAGRWLEAVADGDLTLPVWPDHVGSAGTRFGRYRLRDEGALGDPPADGWTAIIRL